MTLYSRSIHFDMAARERTMQSIHSLYFSLFQHSTLFACFFPPLLYRIPPHSPFSLPSRSPLCTLDSSSRRRIALLCRIEEGKRLVSLLAASFFSYFFRVCSSTLCRREWFLVFFFGEFQSSEKEENAASGEISD